MNDDKSVIPVPEPVVLIDTWWNVNEIIIIGLSVALLVLIDTWWNVNFYYQHHMILPRRVLIDTWWNVNCLATAYRTCISGF